MIITKEKRRGFKVTVLLTAKQAKALRDFLDLKDTTDRALEDVYLYHGDYEDWHVDGSYYLNQIPREDLAYAIVTKDYKVKGEGLEEKVSDLLVLIQERIRLTDNVLRELNTNITKSVNLRSDEQHSTRVREAYSQLYRENKARKQALEEAKELIKDTLGEVFGDIIDPL
jgi:hypothetical protein